MLVSYRDGTICIGIPKNLEKMDGDCCLKLMIELDDVGDEDFVNKLVENFRYLSHTH